MIEEKSIPGGVVHELPADLRKALELHPEALVTWQDITPLARNEWICWIESPKKADKTEAHQLGLLQPQRRQTAPMLLARMPPPLTF